MTFQERVANVLQDSGFVKSHQMEQARQASAKQGIGLLDAMVEQGIVPLKELMRVLGENLGVSVVDLRTTDVDPEAVRLVPKKVATEHSILPLGFQADGSLRVATLAPNDFHLATQLLAITRRQTNFVFALGGDIRQMIKSAYAGGG
jgi:type IV pilus assembly protein PilB